MQPQFERLKSYLGDSGSPAISNTSRNLLWVNVAVLVISILFEIGFFLAFAFDEYVGTDAFLPLVLACVCVGPLLHILLAVIIGIFKPANATSTKYYKFWVFDVVIIIVWGIVFLVMALLSVCVAESQGPLCRYYLISYPISRVIYVVIYVAFYVLHRKMVFEAFELSQTIAMSDLHDDDDEADAELIV